MGFFATKEHFTHLRKPGEFTFLKTDQLEPFCFSTVSWYMKHLKIFAIFLLGFAVFSCEEEEKDNSTPEDFDNLNGLYRGTSYFTVIDSIGDTVSTGKEFGDSLRISNASQNQVDVSYHEINQVHTLNRGPLNGLTGTFNPAADSISELRYSPSVNEDSLVGHVNLYYDNNDFGQYLLNFVKVE